MTLVAARMPWSSLLPPDAAFTYRSGPEWLREMLAENIDGPRRALVLWRARRADLAEADPFFTLVLIRPGLISDSDLHRMGFPYVRRFAVLPRFAGASLLPLDKRATSARWFVPLDTRAISLGALQAMYTPYRRSARLRALAARVATAIGLARLSFDELCIAQRGASPLELSLSNLLEKPVRLGLASTGWGRRTTTTIVAVDRRGRPRAFAKLPTTPLAERTVRHEARILAQIAASQAQSTLAPRLLFEGDVDGRYVTVQSPVEGAPTSTRLSEAHFRFLDRLGSGEPRAAGRSGLIRALALTLSRRDTHPDVRAALEAVKSVLDDVVMPTTLTHGDFFPSNLRVQRGQIAAFDWEDATADGLPLIDVFHHEIEVGFLLRDWAMERASDHLRTLAMRYSGQYGWRVVYALEAAYLMDSYMRRLDGGHTEDSAVAARYYELLRLTTERLRTAAS